MTRLVPMFLLLTACPPSVDFPDTDGPDPDTGSPGDWTTAVVATVSASYSTGTVAAVSLADWTVEDELFVASGDPAVSASEGSVFQLNRYGHDAVRRYDPGAWAAPRWEQALDDQSNPHAARVCAGEVFVTLYGGDVLAVLDLETGEPIDAVDLSAWGDGDGVGPEASTLVAWGDRLYAGLNRLDRAGGWADAGGAVVEIDCEARAVTRAWMVGGNTSVHPWPGGDGLLVLARAHGEDVSGVYALDPDADTLSLRVELPGEPADVAAWGERAVATSLAEDGSGYTLHCLDLSAGELLSSEETDSYLTAAASDDRGRAWVARGLSWVDPEAPTGLDVVDIATCETQTTTPIRLSLHPVSLAFY